MHLCVLEMQFWLRYTSATRWCKLVSESVLCLFITESGTLLSNLDRERLSWSTKLSDNTRIYWYIANRLHGLSSHSSHNNWRKNIHAGPQLSFCLDPDL